MRENIMVPTLSKWAKQVGPSADRLVKMMRTGVA